MRILSIRGENLASLHGPFAIDFEAEPLERAGLFAITGPTGAGKSTLLDAICLALYGTTPRLQAVGGRGHAVGSDEDENRLSSTDAASLLRKGTAAGSAEVSFLGRDGIRYRASWAVRRARNRVDGRVQAPAVQLWNEDTGEAIGRTKTEVYQAIEERVGLSYDQFCRSVLLAQGEFARFLLADEKERAELLERVTGTEIYRTISIAAHQRHTLAKQAVAEVETELRGVRILSEEERASAEAACARLENELALARAELQKAHDAVAWFEALAALVEKEKEAGGLLEEAERHWVEGEPLRQWLAEVEKALPLRHVIAAVSEAEDAETDAMAKRKIAVRDAQETKLASERAKEELAKARGLLDQEQRRLEEATPQLAQARALDQRISAVASQVERDETASREAAERVAKRKVANSELREAIAAQGKVSEAAEDWLQGNATLRPLAPQWERWRDQLLRIAEAKEEETTLEKEAAELRERLAGLEAKRSEAAEGAARAAESLSVAEREVGQAEEAAAKSPRSVLRDRREALDRIERRVLDLLQLAESASRFREEAVALREEAASAEKVAEGAREARTGLAAQRVLLVGQVGEAELALQDARLALDLEEQRSLLREGEACPLCGSIDHPFAAENVALGERLRERSARADELRRTLGAVERSLAEAEAQIKTSERQREEAGARAEKREEEATEVEGRWGERAQRLAEDVETWKQIFSDGQAVALPGRAVEDGAKERLGDLQQRAGRARYELSKEEAEADRLEGAAAAARKRASLLRDAKEEREGRARALDVEIRDVTSAEREHSSRAERARAEHVSLLQLLAPVFDGWEAGRDHAERDPRALVGDLDPKVQSWREKERRLGSVREQISILGSRLEESTSLLVEQEAQASEAVAHVSAAREALGALRKERSLLLDGQDATAVEKTLQDSLAEASAALEKAREDQEIAGAEVTRTATLLASCEAHCREAVDRVAKKRDERDEALKAAGLELQGAVERLSHPTTEVEERRRRLQGLERERQEARARLEDRQRARVEHESTRRPAMDEATARLAKEEKRAPCQEAEEAFHDARTALRMDDEARQQAASILPRLDAAQAEARKWAALHELIGSSSGDKFQLFAQSMTLEVLLAHANVHLEELAPRYRLERVPGHDLQLQVVDRHMGDEIRAANSLSGGETFLVSLALALGLSGLASRTRVESLFVDEGFGTLDPQTLDVALASLDALQASGRKVGVISHVQGMAERIGVQIRVQPQGSGRSSVSVVRG